MDFQVNKEYEEGEIFDKEDFPEIESEDIETVESEDSVEEIKDDAEKTFDFEVLSSFSPRKNYNKEFKIRPFFEDANLNSNAKNWANLLSYLGVPNSKSLAKEISKKDSPSESYNKIKESLNGVKLGKVESIDFLIGQLVNRGPVILDDLLIYGIKGKEFITSKGIKQTSVIKTKLKNNYGIAIN